MPPRHPRASVDEKMMTFASYDRYLRIKDRAERTRTDYRQELTAIAAAHDGADVLTLTPEKIEDYLLKVAA